MSSLSCVSSLYFLESKIDNKKRKERLAFAIRDRVINEIARMHRAGIYAGVAALRSDSRTPHSSRGAATAATVRGVAAQWGSVPPREGVRARQVRAGAQSVRSRAACQSLRYVAFTTFLSRVPTSRHIAFATYRRSSRQLPRAWVTALSAATRPFVDTERGTSEVLFAFRRDSNAQRGRVRALL